MSLTKRKTNKRGFSLLVIIVPAFLLLLVAQVLVIALIMSLSGKSNKLSESINNSGEYISDATGLLAGVSVLSETSTSFVVQPLRGNGEVSVGPLNAYASELRQDRRAEDVLARFETYGVADDVMEHLNVAAEKAVFMFERQQHALALVDAVYDFPDTTELSNLSLPTLPSSEQSWDDDTKLSNARALLLGNDYGSAKSTVSTNVTQSIDLLRVDSDELTIAITSEIETLRISIWIVSASIVLILVSTWFAIYTQLIRPLNQGTRLIVRNSYLQANRGLKEVRLLATAYNNLLTRRNNMDTLLRSAAETDVLTQLPNRYGMEKYLSEYMQDPSEKKNVAIFLFDLNYLKLTNDREGHSAGDELLKSAALCISTCFKSESENNCFRIGGDEFAAFIKGFDPKKIEELEDKFVQMQKEHHVNISWGHAFTETFTPDSLGALMSQADKKMYIHKKAVHGDDTI